MVHASRSPGYVRRADTLALTLGPSRSWALFVQLVRPTTLALIVVQGLYCLALFGVTTPPPRAALALVALASWYAHAVALNDLRDATADAINLGSTVQEAERPLVSGSVSVGQLRTFTGLLTGLCVAATLATSIRLAPLLVVMFALNVAYSVPPLRLTGRGGLAQAVLPVGYVLVPAGFAWALADFGAIGASAWLAVAGLYLVFVGRLMTKDLRDVAGDRAVGKRTFVLRHGLVATLRLSVAGLVGGTTALVVAELLHRGPTVLWWTLVAIAALALVTSFVALRAITRHEDRWQQVRLTGVMGRAVTGLVFCLLVARVLPVTVPPAGALLVVGVCALLFAAGLWLLHEQGRSAWGKR